MFKQFLFFISLMFVAPKALADQPFARLVGEWALKDQQWFQSGENGRKDMIRLTNHRTKCETLNTPNSVVCNVSAPGLSGYILWTYDSERKKLHHLSHFAPNRVGIGEGRINEDGDLSLTVRFPNEGANTHRQYEYEWVNDNEYSLGSTQLRDGELTGGFYGGNFVRLGLTPN